MFDSRNINLQSYEFVHTDSGTRAGGVAFYIKESISYSIRDDLVIVNDENENLWIQVQINNVKYIFAVIYRHPRHNYITFQQKLTKTIESIENQKDTYFICGDLNINLLKYGKSNSVKYYLDSLNSANSRSIIDLPTRITKKQ